MNQSKLSREEIAKQFVLPERRSKIATLLRQEPEYCICRSSDSSRFMIACDTCEEWYHGDCIGISKRESKNIRHYFCERCRAEDPSLKVEFKAGFRPSNDDYATDPDYAYEDEEEENFHKYRKHHKLKHSKHRHSKEDHKSHKKRFKYCGNCKNCLRTEDCGYCSNCEKSSRAGFNHSEERCINRQCLSVSVSKSNRRKKRELEAEPEPFRVFDNSKPRHCFGPGCIKSARLNSKYCSNECGSRLAYHRIYHLIPARLQERTMRICIAEMKNKKELQDVRRKQLEVRDMLKSLDKRHKELDDLLENVKNLTVIPDAEDDQEDEAEVDMYCITCGHQIHTRTAIRHMEKCFNKYESQSSFCSVQKTRIEGNNMFCDYYNPANQTYCKRLRVICPEHSKDPKISDDQACGYPLVTNVFDPTGEFCRVSKKKCIRHYCWEKLRRAEIDMDRVRQWMKLDELVEQEHQIRNFLLTRTGLLPMMLHSTHDHELMPHIPPNHFFNPLIMNMDPNFAIPGYPLKEEMTDEPQEYKESHSKSAE